MVNRRTFRHVECNSQAMLLTPPTMPTDFSLRIHQHQPFHQHTVTIHAIILPFEWSTNFAVAARHVSNLSIAGTPPTYMHANQTNFYAAQYQTYPQTASPFTEYSQELAYLSAPTVPASRSAYWQSARDESVRLLSHGPP